MWTEMKVWAKAPLNTVYRQHFFEGIFNLAVREFIVSIVSIKILFGLDIHYFAVNGAFISNLFRANLSLVLPFPCGPVCFLSPCFVQNLKHNLDENEAVRNCTVNIFIYDVDWVKGVDRKHVHFKCPYYGFLKMTFQAVCNTALSEWKHPESFKSESAPCIQLLSLKIKSRLWIIEWVVFKANPKPFHVDVNMKHWLRDLRLKA